MARHRIRTKRVYEPADPNDGLRVLVDALWPRGVAKADAALDLWAKELAPSAELRRWFGHDPQKWDEFRRRYGRELEDRRDELRALLERAADRPITLLFGARDLEHNNAQALAEVLRRISARK